MINVIVAIENMKKIENFLSSIMIGVKDRSYLEIEKQKKLSGGDLKRFYQDAENFLRNAYHYSLLSESAGENLLFFLKNNIRFEFKQLTTNHATKKNSNFDTFVVKHFYKNQDSVPLFYNLLDSLKDEPLIQEYAVFHTFLSIFSWTFYNSHFSLSATFLQKFTDYSLDKNLTYFVMMVSGMIFHCQLFNHHFIQYFQSLILASFQNSNDWFISNLLGSFWENKHYIPSMIIDCVLKKIPVEKTIEVFISFFDYLFLRLLYLCKNVSSLCGHQQFNSLADSLIQQIVSKSYHVDLKKIVTEFLNSKLKNGRFVPWTPASRREIKLNEFFSDVFRPRIFLSYVDLLVLSKFFHLANEDVDFDSLTNYIKPNPSPEAYFSYIYFELFDVKAIKADWYEYSTPEDEKLRDFPMKLKKYESRARNESLDVSNLIPGYFKKDFSEPFTVYSRSELYNRYNRNRIIRDENLRPKLECVGLLETRFISSKTVIQSALVGIYSKVDASNVIFEREQPFNPFQISFDYFKGDLFRSLNSKSNREIYYPNAMNKMMAHFCLLVKYMHFCKTIPKEKLSLLKKNPKVNFTKVPNSSIFQRPIFKDFLAETNGLIQLLVNKARNEQPIQVFESSLILSEISTIFIQLSQDNDTFNQISLLISAFCKVEENLQYLKAVTELFKQILNDNDKVPSFISYSLKNILDVLEKAPN